MFKVVFFVFMMASVVFADTSEESSKKLYPVTVEGKYGLIDELGKIVIDPIYENCAFLHNMVYAVKDNNYYIFNNDGKLLKNKLLEFEFNLPYHMRNDMDHFFLYSFNGKRGVIDTMLNGIVDPLYDFIEIVENKYFIVSKNSKKGVVNLQGKVVVDIIYDYIRYLKEDYFSVSVDEKYGIINSEGKLIVPVECSSIGWQFQDEVIWVSSGGRSASGVIVGGKWALIRKDGYNITGFTYDAVGQEFSDGLCSVNIGGIEKWEGIRDGKWGYIDKSGKMVIPFNPLYVASSFENGYAVVGKDKKWGVINKKGNYVLSLKYSQIRNDAIGLFIVTLGGIETGPHLLSKGQNMLINTDRKILFGPTVKISLGDWMDGFREGFLRIYDTEMKKYGYLNENGIVCIPIKYDQASNFSNGVAEVRIGSDIFKINYSGQRLTREDERVIQFGKQKWRKIVNENSKLKEVTIEFLDGEKISIPNKTIISVDDKIIEFVHVEKNPSTNASERKHAYVNIELQKIVWVDK